MLRVWSGFPGACSVRTCVLVPPPASCGEERHIKHHHMDDALSGIHRTSLEPRGGNEPPRPRRRSHGCGPAFCYSTRHISAYFLRLTKSRCGMPARRAPDRLACFAHSSSGFLSRFACVRLPRMGATQYSRWTELHSLGATLLLAPACWRIPSLHAPPGAAAF